MNTISHYRKPTLKTIILCLCLVLPAIVVNAQTAGDYRSTASGNWSSISIWEQWSGSAWVAATVAPPANHPTVTISILNSHNVTLASTVSSGISKTIIETGGTLIVAPGKTLRFGSAVAGNKLAISGTLLNNGVIVFSGTSVVNSGGLLNNVNPGELTFSGSTLQLSVNGTFRNSSDEITTPSSACIEFNNGSTYDHNFTTTPGVIPFATWNTGATCRISGYTSNTSNADNIDQDFYNFDWNTPSLTASPSNVSLRTIKGNLTVSNTGSGSIRINALTSIAGNFSTLVASRVQFGRINSLIGIKGNISFATGSIVSVEKLSLLLDNTSANQTIDSKGITLNELVIDKPSFSVTISSSLRIKELLSVLSINSIVNSNGNLRLLSTNDEGMGDASVAKLPSGSSVTGTVVVEHYMSNEGNIYRYISSPVSNFPVSGIQADFPVTGSFTGASSCSSCASQSASMYYYSTATTSYIAFPKSPQTNATVFQVGRGYSAFINQNTLPGPITIRWTGTINQGTINLPVAYSGNPNTSWNLIGNPYPSTIDWSKGIGNGWAFTNVAQSIAVKDNSTGLFHYYPDDAGETFNSGLIAKGQSFWVRTTGSNPTLQINEDAKASEIGTFYRMPSITDRLVLSLSNGSISDRAYVKVIDNASLKMDDYDAPKMTNDGVGTLNLSSLLTVSNLPMAINAVDKIACNDTIKLKMNGAGGQSIAAGNYSISLSSLGVMSDFNWVLRDTYLQSNVTLSNDASYSFAVTTVSASKAANRFILIAKQKSANLALAVTGTKQVCGESDGVLKIMNTESRITYAVEINGKQIGEAVNGNNSSLSFSLQGSSLSNGSNIVKVIASSDCAQDYLTESLVVSKAAYYVPTVQVSSQCQKGSITLVANNPNVDQVVRWYASKESGEVLATLNTFTTPVLTKSKTYYMAGVNALGCEGERIAVRATITSFDDVKITKVNGTELQSSIENGNQWYFNNEMIVGATGKTIEIKEQGTYAVSTKIESCTTTAQFVVAVAAAPENSTEETKPVLNNLAVTQPVDEQFESSVLIYPNPVVNGPLHIEVPTTVQSVQLLNSMGAVIQGNVAFTETINGSKKADIDFSQHPVGIYFIVTKNSEKTVTFKVLNR